MTQDQEKVNLVRLSYVHYAHSDLLTFRKFAQDFGFEEASASATQVYYRGYGKDNITYIASQALDGSGNEFKGIGFTAKSQEDFERACRLTGAEVKDASKRPGGGELVAVPDVNGFTVEVVWDAKEQETPARTVSLAVDEPLSTNGALEKPRKGDYKRYNKGPSPIHKLGHTGYTTSNWEATFDWYTSTFNLAPTDILTAPNDKTVNVAAFLHLDLGKTYVDHHSFLIARGESGTSVHHSSFEVEDYDTQELGHYHLVERGYDNLWGIGRHVHGSQIFDYWNDTSGFIVEHYSDGDLVNEDHKITYTAAGEMAVWGPEPPSVWTGKAGTKVSA